MSIVRKKAGRISPVLMGDYDNSVTYRRLDWVYYGGTSYICKKNNTVGIAPSNTDKWQKIIELPTEINMTFNTATTRTNIASGEKLSVILGKIAKFFADLKDVAFTGNYTDLSNRPNSLKNPNTLNIKFNGAYVANYDGSTQKEVNITPAGISAVNTSALLNTTEQISANTDVNNITGALAAKAMMADYNNKINTIFSNLVNDCYLLHGGQAINENANLNDYKTPGNYYCALNAIAATLSNCPISEAFTLKVEMGNGISYPCQTLRNFHNGQIFYRFFTGNPNNDNGWDPWYTMPIQVVNKS